MKKETFFLSGTLVLLGLICVVVLAGFIKEKADVRAANEVAFSDVNEEDWYYEDVLYAVDEELMNGISDTEFSPEDTTTRGMIAVILWRLDGSPVKTAKAFTDVKRDDYYFDAVAWAFENQIISGYSETTFGPEDAITREQLATMMYRYALYKKYDVSAQKSLDGYTDVNQISDYAVLAFQWVNANDIITGTSESTLTPQGDALRCQVAAILKRFCEKYTPLETTKKEPNYIGGADNILTDDSNKEQGQQVSDHMGGGLSSNSSSSSKEDENEPNTGDMIETQNPIIKTSIAYGNPGDNVSVTLNLQKNPGILGMILNLEYDEGVMRLLNVTNGEAVSEVLTLTPSKSLASGVRFVWDGLDLSEDDIKDGTLLTLEFELFDNATVGKRYPLKLQYDEGDIVDAYLNEVMPQIQQGYIEIEDGE